jgi:hypothetical protein
MDDTTNAESLLKDVEPRHQCLIYDGAPSGQLPALAAVIQRKLAEGHRCLYLNSPPMVAGLRSRLVALGVDVMNETAKTRLVLSSNPVTSADGDFDVDLMLQNLEDAVDQALNDGHKGLWATGDMTWEFGPERNFAKLVEYELRLEKLFHKKPGLCGICQYHLATLPQQAARQGFLTHPSFFINQTLSRLNPHYAPFDPPGDQTIPSPELDAMIAALCQLQNARSR